MRKFLQSIAIVLLLISITTGAFAKSLFDRHWNKGEYLVELSDEEEAKYAEIFEKALYRSEGTATKTQFDAASRENDYRWYIEHKHLIGSREYDDIGTFTPIYGLPDEQVISQQQALYIAYHVLQEQYNISDDKLTMLLPFWTYTIPESDTPVWVVTFRCYDFTNDFHFYAYLYIYAYDGSIWGIHENHEEAEG